MGHDCGGGLEEGSGKGERFSMGDGLDFRFSVGFVRDDNRCRLLKRRLSRYMNVYNSSSRF